MRRHRVSSDVDVAAPGGRENTASLKTAYQEVDAETILRVVLEGP